MIALWYFMLCVRLGVVAKGYWTAGGCLWPGCHKVSYPGLFKVRKQSARCPGGYHLPRQLHLKLCCACNILLNCVWIWTERECVHCSERGQTMILPLYSPLQSDMWKWILLHIFNYLTIQRKRKLAVSYEGSMWMSEMMDTDKVCTGMTGDITIHMKIACHRK